MATFLLPSKNYLGLLVHKLPRIAAFGTAAAAEEDEGEEEARGGAGPGGVPARTLRVPRAGCVPTDKKKNEKEKHLDALVV